MPFLDGYDNYYMRLPSSWGQIWTRSQWHEFRSWLPEYDENESEFNELLPPNVKNWPQTSWKKCFQNYLIIRNKLVLYPRISLTTNFMDAGTHHKVPAFFLQSPPLTYKIDEYGFSTPEASNSIYDKFCERGDKHFKEALQKEFGIDDVIVDLYGTKNLDMSPGRFAFTSQEIDNEVKVHFSQGLRPHELNLTAATQLGSNGSYRLVRIPGSKPLELPIKSRPSSLEQLLCYYVMPKGVFLKEAKLAAEKQASKKFTRKEAILTILPKKVAKILRLIMNKIR
jgi:hypothetical protein